MENNLILRRLRYFFNYDDEKISSIFNVFGDDVSIADASSFLKKEGEDGYRECSDELLCYFLDGLILQERGPKEGAGPYKVESRLNNNDILKKIRIALQFREDEMLKTFSKGGSDISKSELSSFFRRRGHKHYQELGDQLLRRFLLGLTK